MPPVIQNIGQLIQVSKRQVSHFHTTQSHYKTDHISSQSLQQSRSNNDEGNRVIHVNNERNNGVCTRRPHSAIAKSQLTDSAVGITAALFTGQNKQT